MKAYLRIGAFSLFVVSCHRPESDLFGVDDSGSSTLQGGNTNNGTSGSLATAAAPGAGAGAQAGVTGEGGRAGSATAGTSPGVSAAGEPSSPQPSGGEGMGGEPSAPAEPVCGNGIIEAGEQCDDAGHAGQDGCAACQVVCSQYGADTLASEDHHCYAGYGEATFEGARKDCEERGAHLATISSLAENDLVQTLVNTSKFLGASEDIGLMAKGNADYRWLTAEPFTFTNWAQGEPDQKATRCSSYSSHCYEHCLAMNGQGFWVDQRCDVEDGYVCEWEPPNAP
jgi:cysteine-rich repeat protein